MSKDKLSSWDEMEERLDSLEERFRLLCETPIVPSIWDYVSIRDDKGGVFVPRRYAKEVAAAMWPDCEMVETTEGYTMVKVGKVQ